MNLYFLLEGKRTEPKIYPKWLSYLLPRYKQVCTLHEIEQNTYYLMSGRGYPSLLNHIKNSISDLQNHPNIDYLIISVDCDEESPEERFLVIENEINQHRGNLERDRIIVILQNRCIETWLLGNRKVFVHNPQDNDLQNYISFYNVSENDPEQMVNNGNFNTISQFHTDYLKKMLSEKNISYTKTNPSDTAESYYLENLIKRVDDTGDLKSFKTFLETMRHFAG